MQSILSTAAVRSLLSVGAALLSPSRRVCVEEVGEWMTARRLSDTVLSYADGSGLEVAFRGRLWIITTEARRAALGAA